MRYIFTPFSYILQFKFIVRTSRGILPFYKKAYFIKIHSFKNSTPFGIGECSPFPGLSIDDVWDFEVSLKKICKKLTQSESADSTSFLNIIYQESKLLFFPSIVFALETALLDLKNNGKKVIFSHVFKKNKIRTIPINGLVWIGNKNFMLSQIRQKIDEGYTTLKVKIDNLHFEERCQLLSFIRKNFSDREIAIRLDANGAFSLKEALEKLYILSKYSVHSIEQPISVGEWEEMAILCKKSPFPIALDEELIGINYSKRSDLLDTIRPQYIVLKPTLLGGLKSIQDWIVRAEKKQIGWWITSALESNVGLNAIAQFVLQYENLLPQGLGTGQLYENNFISPLSVKDGDLFLFREKKWDYFETLKRI